MPYETIDPTVPATFPTQKHDDDIQLKIGAIAQAVLGLGAAGGGLPAMLAAINSGASIPTLEHISIEEARHLLENQWARDAVATKIADLTAAGAEATAGIGGLITVIGSVLGGLGIGLAAGEAVSQAQGNSPNIVSSAAERNAIARAKSAQLQPIVDPGTGTSKANKPQVSHAPAPIYANNSPFISNAQHIQIPQRRSAQAQSPTVSLNPPPATSPASTAPAPLLQSHAPINTREYGHLLHNPVSSIHYEMPTHSDTDLQSALKLWKDHQETAAKEFANWANNPGAKNIPIHHSGVALMPIPGGTGRTPVFGNGIAVLPEIWHQQAQAALKFPSVAFIPAVAKATNVPIKFPNMNVNPFKGGGGVTASGSCSTMPGKIDNLKNKLNKSLNLSKIMDMVTLAVTLHNAAMLSTNVVASLLDFMSNIANLLGIKDLEGHPINVGEYVSKGLQGIIEGAVGKSTVAAAKKKWAAWSAVYTVGANIVTNVSTIFGSAQNILQTTADHMASNVGLIGNGLKKAGLIGEKIDGFYNHMAEQVDSRLTRYAAFTQTMEGVENLASTVDSMSQDAVTVRDTAVQTRDLIKTDFPKALHTALTGEGAAKDATETAGEASIHTGPVEKAE